MVFSCDKDQICQRLCTFFLVLGGIWLVGIAGFIFMCRSMRVQTFRSEQSEQELTRRFEEQKFVLENLEQTQNLLTVISQQVPGMIYQCCLFPDGLFSFPYASSAITELYGLTPAQVLTDASPLFAVIYPDDIQGLQDSLRLSAEVLETWEYEYRVLLPGLDIRWHYGIAVPSRQNDGTVLWHGCISDVTNKKNVDITHLKYNENKMHKLSCAIEQSPTSILITDSKGQIEFVNRSFTKNTGYTFDEAIGQMPYQLSSDSTTSKLYADIWTTILSGHSWNGELQDKRKDGSILWEHVIVSPLYDDSGAISNFVAVKEDITEKKELIAQLVHSQKVETIGQLAGGLAHDLNNKLSIINAYGILLKMASGMSAEHIQYVNEIMAASNRAGAITHSMLAYGRKQIMRIKTENLNVLLSKVGQFIKHLIREDIELTIELSDEPLMTYIDAGQIEQVMINLATNARDAMPRGGTLHISARAGLMPRNRGSESESTDKVRCAIITVSDTGHGMNEETQRCIFDPFFTTKDVGKGTGLGLSMVFGIIMQHDGIIDVQSSVGVGTVFSLQFPLAESMPDQWSDGEINRYTSPESITSNHLATILLVEDDVNFCNVMSKILIQSGYNVITAMDGCQAVDIFTTKKDEIDLVISDVIMPNKSGKATYEEIRALSQKVPFIFISGHAQDVIGNLGGSDDIELIEKPLNPLELISKIKKLTS